MPTPKQVLRQINDRIRRLVQSGLADNQLTAFQRKAGRRIEIVFPNAEYISATLKNIDYVDMYRLLVQARAYNLKMCDGALIQMMYDFSDRTLLRHRWKWQLKKGPLWPREKGPPQFSSTHHISGPPR